MHPLMRQYAALAQNMVIFSAIVSLVAALSLAVTTPHLDFEKHAVSVTLCSALTRLYLCDSQSSVVIGWRVMLWCLLLLAVLCG